MRVLNIIQRYHPAIGGSETWCRDISQYLAGLGHSVRVLTLNVDREEEFWSDPPGLTNYAPFPERDIDGVVSIRRYRRTLPGFLTRHLLFKRILDWKFGIHFYGPHSFPMYVHLFGEMSQCDVVVLHTLPFPHNYVGYFAARAVGKPVVIVPHFHPGHPDYERRSHYTLMNKCDAVIADTEFERAHLLAGGISPEKVSVVGVGIDSERYTRNDRTDSRSETMKKFGIASNEKTILFIGRKLENKGIAVLVDAVRKMRSQLPLKLILAGPSFEWFDRFYASLTPEEKSYILDAGVISEEEKIDLLYISGLLVLPSKYEAFGIAFLEAWACGVPVIGTREGAMPELIADGGWTVPYGDADALANQLREVIGNPALLRSTGERGKERVLIHHRWTSVGARMDSLLTGEAIKG